MKSAWLAAACALAASMVASLVLAQPPTAAPPVAAAPETVELDDLDDLLADDLLGDDLFSSLAGAPHMYGDFLATGLGYSGGAVGNPLTFQLGLSGTLSRQKIGDHNSPFPQHRCYFVYNHYHHALSTDLTNFGGGATSLDIDRYLVGVERPFANGLMSCELRLPTFGHTDFTGAIAGFDSSQIGDLSVILKALLYADQQFAWAAGMGVTTPTGGDTTGVIGPFNFRVHADAVYLLPYTAIALQPQEDTFVQLFTQLDIPLSGNPIDIGGIPVPGRVGVYNEQLLMQFDLQAGRWLYRDGAGRALAAMGELHYTSSLEDSDLVQGQTGGSPLNFRNLANRFDILNFTSALHLELSSTTVVRIGATLPLRDQTDRTFDAEVSAMVMVRR